MRISPLFLPRLPRRPRRSLRLWLPLAAFPLLLGAAAPAVANLTITGLEFEYIDGGTYQEGDELEVYVEPHSFPGPAYNCRWRFPSGTTQVVSGHGINATTVGCDLLSPLASTFGNFEIEVTSIGNVWSDPWPTFTYDCEPGRGGPGCLTCSCHPQETAAGYCNENLTGDGTCNRCVDAVPYQCGPTCNLFCRSVHCAAGNPCDQSSCGCLACETGYWGDESQPGSIECNEVCPTGCAGAGDPCDRATGNCFDCDPGLYGEQCTLTAPPVPSLSPLGIGVLFCAGLGIEGLRRLRKHVREAA